MANVRFAAIWFSPAPAGDIYPTKGRRYETDARGLKALKVVQGAIETAFEMGLVATNLGQNRQQSYESPPVGIIRTPSEEQERTGAMEERLNRIAGPSHHSRSIRPRGSEFN